MAASKTSGQVRRALTLRQWQDLRSRDVPLLADVAKRVNLEKLKAAILENDDAMREVDSDDDDLEIVLHHARAGDVIDWETHTDELQFVFVAQGRLRVKIRGSRENTDRNLTLAFVWPGDNHKLEALTDARYASVYVRSP